MKFDFNQKQSVHNTVRQNKSHEKLTGVCKQILVVEANLKHTFLFAPEARHFFCFGKFL